MAIQEISARQTIPHATSKAQTLVASLELPFQAHLTMVTTHQGLATLATAWRALEKNTRMPTGVFQSYDWVSSWAQIYLQPQSKLELSVLAGYHNQQLVFVWPLMKARCQGVTTLRWLTEPFSQYGDVLCAPDQHVGKWVEESVRFLKRLKGIDLIRLRHVRDDSNVGNYAHKHFQNARLAERAPFLDLSLFENIESYEARYTSIQRKRRKKIRKEIENLGVVSFEKLASGTIADQEIAAALFEKNAWLSDRGKQNLVLGCPHHLQFLKVLSRANNSAVEVVTSVLRAGTQSVSWEIGFRFGNTHFAYLTSHVNKMTDLSPGRLHMDFSQRSCIKDGVTRFDLMVPYDPHKESWSSGMITTNDYYLPLSAKGKLYGTAYLKFLRPVLRRIYYALPAKVLRLLKPITGH